MHYFLTREEKKCERPVEGLFLAAGVQTIKVDSLGRAPSRRLISRSEDLADRTQVVRGVCNRGESGCRVDVVPVGANGDTLLPFIGLLAETVAKHAPLVVCNGCALPASIPVGVGPGVFFPQTTNASKGTDQNEHDRHGRQWRV